MLQHKVPSHLPYLEVRQVSLADARALASVFVASFQNDGMSCWVWQLPPENVPKRDSIMNSAVDERVIGRRPELCDPAIHMFGIYDTSTSHNGQPKLIGQSGWKVYKPKSENPSVSPLVTRYKDRIRQRTLVQSRDKAGHLYDTLANVLIPNWLYRHWNPKLAAMLDRRWRWTSNRAVAYKKAVTAEDTERGYYTVVVLGLLPEYERRGIGAMLLKWGLDRADEGDVATYVSATPAGAKLYMKLGFETVSERTCFPGEPLGGFPATILRRKRPSEWISSDYLAQKATE